MNTVLQKMIEVRDSISISYFYGSSIFKGDLPCCLFGSASHFHANIKQMSEVTRILFMRSIRFLTSVPPP
ncbi:unnamed protein product [Linum trigynum]|uniref:Phosphatidate cytidylyltransferase n=1 Tax=Linum trigynum TaxID=586398 RepID=A0AAV2FHA1_9ROSI